MVVTRLAIIVRNIAIAAITHQPYGVPDMPAGIQNKVVDQQLNAQQSDIDSAAFEETNNLLHKILTDLRGLDSPLESFSTSEDPRSEEFALTGSTAIFEQSLTHIKQINSEKLVNTLPAEFISLRNQLKQEAASLQKSLEELQKESEDALATFEACEARQRKIQEFITKIEAHSKKMIDVELNHSSLAIYKTVNAIIEKIDCQAEQINAMQALPKEKLKDLQAQKIRMKEVADALTNFSTSLADKVTPQIRTSENKDIFKSLHLNSEVLKETAIALLGDVKANKSRILKQKKSELDKLVTPLQTANRRTTGFRPLDFFINNIRDAQKSKLTKITEALTNEFINDWMQARKADAGPETLKELVEEYRKKEAFFMYMNTFLREGLNQVHFKKRDGKLIIDWTSKIPQINQSTLETYYNRFKPKVVISEIKKSEFQAKLEKIEDNLKLLDSIPVLDLRL